MESTWREAANGGNSSVNIIYKETKLASVISKVIMNESCMDLGLDEVIRLKLSSMISVGHAYGFRPEGITDEFIKKTEELNIQLNFPKGLIKYMTEHNTKTRRNYNLKEITRTYISYYITKATSKAQLEQYKELNIKRVKIKTCKDQRVCDKCKKHDDVSYLVSKVAVLPLCWGCRCIYRPEIK